MKNSPLTKMKKGFIIIGLCIIVVLVIGASYRLSLSLLLNAYEEECLSYDYTPIIEEVYGCIKYEDCDYVLCDCKKKGYVNMTVNYKKGECEKYHLVRKTGATIHN